jgi:hypothetical protein
MPIQTVSANNSLIKLLSGIQVSVDSLEVTPVEIEELSFSNFVSNFDYSHGTIKNAKVRFEIKVVLNWSINYDVELFGETIETTSKEGSFDLFNCDTDFINVDLISVVPGKMKIDLPNLRMKRFKEDLLRTTSGDSSSKITIDKTELNKIAMDETVITNSSPALFGGTVPIKNPFGPQNMSISNTKMDDFSAIKIKLPPFYLTNLDMQGIEVAKVSSDNFEIKAHTKKESSASKILDLISLWSTINIMVTMKADKIEYSDLNGNIKSDKTMMKGMTMDLRLRNIQIKDLKFDEFDIPDIGIGL